VKTAGGVGTSGLEMSQNSHGLAWTRDEVDKEHESIMKLVHRFFFIWRLAYIWAYTEVLQASARSSEHRKPMALVTYKYGLP